ncbi:MAG: hypothetical protein ACJAZ3_001249 [Sphingobacteriales bacterium]|jgi:uncharacterized protein YciI
MDGGQLRGLYIFDVQTIEEAQALSETDPAVQAGVFELELVKWYGSAGVKEISDIHK